MGVKSKKYIKLQKSGDTALFLRVVAVIKGKFNGI